MYVLHSHLSQLYINVVAVQRQLGSFFIRKTLNRLNLDYNQESCLVNYKSTLELVV